MSAMTPVSSFLPARWTRRLWRGLAVLTLEGSVSEWVLGLQGHGQPDSHVLGLLCLTVGFPLPPLAFPCWVTRESKWQRPLGFQELGTVQVGPREGDCTAWRKDLTSSPSCPERWEEPWLGHPEDGLGTGERHCSGSCTDPSQTPPRHPLPPMWGRGWDGVATGPDAMLT